jgi:hypothetical protein
MHLDFAREYARRTDDEIRLLIPDRHNLVNEARDALDVEIHKRRSRGFDPDAREAEKPRVHVEEDKEEGNEVVVRSRELVFPKICPRCLSPADGAIRMVCPGSSWSILPVLRYLFCSYSVPFCRRCARSVGLRRWAERILYMFAGAGLFVVFLRFHLSGLAFGFTLLAVFFGAALIWKQIDRSKRWPPAGIEILSKWSAQERRLQFANPAYEKAFIALNGEIPPVSRGGTGSPG